MRPDTEVLLDSISERLDVVARWLDAFVNIVGRVWAWIVVPLILLMVVDVIVRKFFPELSAQFWWLQSTKLQELQWWSHAALFMFTIAFVYLQDGHVRIDLIRENLSVRSKAVIELIAIVVFLTPYLWMTIYFGSQYWYTSFLQNESSSAPNGLPNLWIIKAVLPLGFMVLAIAGLSMLLRVLITIQTGRPPPSWKT